MPDGVKSYRHDFLGRVREKPSIRSQFTGLPEFLDNPLLIRQWNQGYLQIAQVDGHRGRRFRELTPGTVQAVRDILRHKMMRVDNNPSDSDTGYPTAVIVDDRTSTDDQDVPRPGAGVFGIT